MKNKGTSKKKNMADLLFADLRRPRRPRQFKPAINIETFTDEELRNRFRFGRQGIGYITNVIADELRRSTRRNRALPPLQQVLVALRFHASGSFLQGIGDTASVDKSTVSRRVTNVSNALIAKQSEFITKVSTSTTVYDICRLQTRGRLFEAWFALTVG